MTGNAETVGLEKRRLGREGPTLTTLGFGTWAIGGPYRFGWGPQDDAESIAAIRRGVESGINWIDTAPVYGIGHSEEVVGRAVRPYALGEEVYLATKCGRKWIGPREGGGLVFDLRPESIREECEESLERLGVERIDLFQFHWPDTETGTAVEDSWGTMQELVEEGKVRWRGVSNFDVGLLERCERIAHVDSLQPPFSLIDRRARRELIPWCAARGVGVVVYSPMASGLLSGKYTTAAMEELAPDDWRRRFAPFQEPRLSRNLALVDRLKLVAARLETTLPALAVAWTLATPGVTSAIVGGRRPDQVDGWIPATELRLSERDLSEIEAAIVDTGAGDE
ncbi:MAG TPA: aldo/keto reductase [Gemmatimonadota bacterium]|nr:aldo/keto reductase [Gemmatimonadota bacterium]